MNDIILEIENFSPIRKANIKLGKINIIAGKNATGKTTISKILYSLMASISREGDRIYQQKIISIIKNLLTETFRFTDEFPRFQDKHRELYFLVRSDEINDFEMIHQKIIEVKDIFDENNTNSNKINALIDEILNYLKINTQASLKKNKIIELFLCNEFGNEKKFLKNGMKDFLNYIIMKVVLKLMLISHLKMIMIILLMQDLI